MTTLDEEITTQQFAMPDVEQAPPCEEQYNDEPPCTNLAAWRLRVLHPDGGHCIMVLCCNHHRDRILAMMEYGSRRRGAVSCARHDISGAQLVWTAL
jgi:hypothetical protein